MTCDQGVVASGYGFASNATMSATYHDDNMKLADKKAFGSRPKIVHKAVCYAQ